MDLNELAKEAHQIAVDHGWWDPEPTFGELIALMHSELSEALEEYRAGRPMVWYECDVSDTKCEPGQYYYTVHCCRGCGHRGHKPEGIAVELADCIIRILDLFGHEGEEIKPVPILRDCTRFKYGEIIGECHWMLSKAYENGRHPAVSAVYLNRCVSYILAWAAENNVNIESIIREKMDYNKTRPYRHGGKKL